MKLRLCDWCRKEIPEDYGYYEITLWNYVPVKEHRFNPPGDCFDVCVDCFKDMEKLRKKNNGFKNR